MRRTADDFGAELQKFQADGIGDGLGQGRLFQGDAADTVDEDIGEIGEEQAELVGFVGVRAHAIGEQIELAVLDAEFSRGVFEALDLRVIGLI